MVTLTPAYGRDYRSKTSAIADLEAGKDFILNDYASKWNGKPCSILDFEPGTQVKVRYKQLRMVFVYNIQS